MIPLSLRNAIWFKTCVEIETSKFFIHLTNLMPYGLRFHTAITGEEVFLQLIEAAGLQEQRICII